MILRKFEGVDFKYDITFLNPAQKYLNKVFSILDLRVLIFEQNFDSIKIRGRWFQIWEQLFKIPVQKNPNKAFLDQRLQLDKF